MEKFIKELADEIDMKILHGPVVAEGIPENPGLSGFAIIDYSHISIHTFTNSNETLIDVFSCKPYDKVKALKVCQEYYSTDEAVISEKEVWWG
jgi:S-adenosylmethionine decarboxylase